MVARGAVAHPLVTQGHLGQGLPRVTQPRPARSRRGLPGWHERAGARQGGRRQRGARLNALGRSRGGFGTKACTICDALGRAIAFALLPGQGHELSCAPTLLSTARALGRVERVICDRGYSSVRWRRLIKDAGAEPVVPKNPTHWSAPSQYNRAAYRRRHRVENLWARLKEWRALATCYDKTSASYLGTLYLAAALDWLHNRP